MVSDKRNNNFLSRINEILGDRKKHPWGRDIGLKNTRINDMFSGKIPHADALIRVRRAEKVSLDWLLTGDGTPYLYKSGRCQTDLENAELLKQLLEEDDWMVYLVYHQVEEGVAVVLTHPAIVKYEDITARFMDVEMMQAGAEVINRLKGRLVKEVKVEFSVYERLVCGWLGPVDLTGENGLLNKSRDTDLNYVAGVLSKSSSHKLTNMTENKLITHFRHLRGEQQKAVLALLNSMDQSVDILQPPPGGFVLDAKGDRVDIDDKPPLTDKVRSDD